MQRLIPFLDKLVTVALFVFVAFSMFSISVTQIACGVGGIAWAWRTHLTGSWRDQRWPLWIPFGLFTLACLIAVANGYDFRYSYKPLKKLLEILIFFWVVNCVRENRLRDSLFLFLVVFSTFAGLYGLYQGWRDGVSLLSRVEGTMSVYMTFAGILMMVELAFLGRMMFKRSPEAWLWAQFLIISCCLLLTLTRQAWFGLLLGLAFLIFLKSKKYFLVLTVCVFTVVILVMGPMNKQAQNLLAHKGMSFVEQMKHRIYYTISGKDPTFLMRKALWQGGWEIFKDYPVTGCGFQCVDRLLLHKKYPDPTGHIRQFRGMHNNFVQLAVDTGILGLSAWLGIWFCFFRSLRKRALALEDDPAQADSAKAYPFGGGFSQGESSDQWVLFGSAAAVIGFLGGGFFESNFYDSEVAMVLYFIMALPFAGSQNPPQVPNVEYPVNH